MPLGITYNQIDKDSFLGLAREDFHWPLALDVDYFSAATAGGAQGNFDISASVAGTSVFLSAQAAKPLYHARRPSISITDASGTSLTCTVRIVGRRFGELVTQDIVSAAAQSGTIVTTQGSKTIDEVVSVTILAIANNTTSDILSVGFGGGWLGLRMPIRSWKDVKMILKVATVTPDAAGPKISSDLSSSLVNAADASIDIETLYSATIAVTHSYFVEYNAASPGKGFARRKGLRFV